MAGEDRDWREEVEFRRGRREEYLTFTLPQAWEGDPERIPVGAADQPGDESELTGIGASPGSAEGIVRVVRDAGSAELADGEILVCETTDPSWATLFLIAGAVVIDVGSRGSHGAIVARELGLPCVINTRSGTAALRDGDRVLVDGDAGSVRVLQRAAG